MAKRHFWKRLWTALLDGKKSPAGSGQCPATQRTRAAPNRPLNAINAGMQGLGTRLGPQGHLDLLLDLGKPLRDGIRRVSGSQLGLHSRGCLRFTGFFCTF